MVPACVARVHTVLPADWDWSGARVTPAALATPTAVAAAAAGSPFSDKSAAASAAAGAGGAGSNEDLRERAELQRAYYSFCHSLVSIERWRRDGGAQHKPPMLTAPPWLAGCHEQQSSLAWPDGCAACGGYSDVLRCWPALAQVHNRLAGVLLGAPPGTLDAMLGALMRGAATHVDAGEGVGGWLGSSP